VLVHTVLRGSTPLDVAPGKDGRTRKGATTAVELQQRHLKVGPNSRGVKDNGGVSQPSIST
jgi:hypothetical protein